MLKDELKQLAKQYAELFLDTFFLVAEQEAKKQGLTIKEFLNNWLEKVKKIVGDNQ